MIKSKKIKENLFNKLDRMCVLMDRNDVEMRLKSKSKWIHLFMRASPEVKNYIWFTIQSTLTYAKQKAYKSGYEKGLVEGALRAKGIEVK